MPGYEGSAYMNEYFSPSQAVGKKDFRDGKKYRDNDYTIDRMILGS